jgi:hypothetical protein
MKNGESGTGKGVKGFVEGKLVALGNRTPMTEFGIDIASLAEPGERLRADGQTAMFVSEGNRVLGVVGVADPIKATYFNRVSRSRCSSRLRGLEYHGGEGHGIVSSRGFDQANLFFEASR